MPRGVYERKPVKPAKPAVKDGKPRLVPWKESRRYRELFEIAKALEIRGNSQPLIGTEQVAYALRIRQILDREYKRLPNAT